MKKTLVKHIITGLMFILLNPAIGQESALFVEHENVLEKMFAETDRNTYAVSEYIRFRAFNLSPDSLKESRWSNVLYLEIISPDGVPIVQQKYNYDANGANGILHVPQGILTGNYYLRAYTRWMRNYSPATYFYKTITLINPASNEVLQPIPDTQNEIVEVDALQINQGKLKLSINKTTFNKREKVEVTVANLENSKPTNFSVSVVKKELKNNTLGLARKKTGAVKNNNEFLPETRGLSLSGKIVSRDSSDVMPYHQVNLTIIKEVPEILGAITDENGRFYFDLSELWGEYELFVSTGTGLTSNSPEILIDNDFSSQEIQLPFIPFESDKQNMEILNELSLNSQLEYFYGNENILTAREMDSGDVFYGEPDFVLDFDEFIELPTLEEYFHELVPYVSVRTEKGIKKLKVQGKSAELKTFDPLVMVDLIAIADISAVLRIPPGNIDRIEVINEPYVRGDLTYGGIVNIVSKSGNIAGIDLPSSGRFLNYKMFNRQTAIANSSITGQRIPDVRNCLYWNPSFSLEPGQNKKLVFYTGDTKGEYSIIATQVNKEGNVSVSETIFKVKE